MPLNYKNSKNILFFAVVFTTLNTFANASLGYDPGPDHLDQSVGEGYMEVLNSTPDFSVIGKFLNNGRDKFRFPFGSMPLRGPTEKNKVKILVIGQDGTHIAEAAGRPFTGGTGGRVQNALAYLGVRDSAMFMNTFSFTIYGQYGDWAPILKNDKLIWTGLLSPEAYLLGQDLNNPIVQWRNKLIDQIIDSNRDSLKLIYCIGGAAKDTLATYIRSRGGNVPFYVDENEVKNYQAVLYNSERSVLNRSVFFPVDKEGKNILLNPGERPNYGDEAYWEELVDRAPERMDSLVKVNGGVSNTGIYHLGQFGYDLYNFNPFGTKNSLKGLTTSKNNKIDDIRVLMFKHPGSMSPTLERNFQQSFDRLIQFRREGWEDPVVDVGQFNSHLAGAPFKYNQKPSIPQKDFPLGKSQAVIVNQSLASRSGKQIIVFGGRSRPKFNSDAESEAKFGNLNDRIDPASLNQPWNPPIVDMESDIYEFDRGPGKEWAELFSSIDLNKVFKPKDGMSVKEDGIKALNVKNYEEHGAFGFFRGNINSPQVLVIADPQSTDLDDLYTARALTGLKGQQLQAFMEGLGVSEDYLVIKTLPFDMTNATTSEWKITLDITKDWRESIIRKAIKALGQGKLILTLGPYADEIVRNMKISPSPRARLTIPKKYIHISLTDGFESAYEQIEALSHQSTARQALVEDIRLADPSQLEYGHAIPRRHLPYPMQVWAGTSGSRGLRATGKLEGLYYGIVAPKWVLDKATKNYVEAKRNVPDFIKNASQDIDNQGFGPLGQSLQILGNESL